MPPVSIVIGGVFRGGLQFEIIKGVVSGVLILVMNDSPYGHQLASVEPPHEMVLVYVPAAVLEARILRGCHYKSVFTVLHGSAL